MCDQQWLRLACAYARSDRSHCWSLEHSMTLRLLIEHYLEFLSLKGGYTGSSESNLSKCHIVGNHMSRLVCHRSASQVMPNDDPRDRYPHTHL